MKGLACALALLSGAPQAASAAPLAIVHPHDSLGGLLRCLSGRTTLVSAHRGGVEPGYPENALETFANTLVQAPMLLEVDVRSTRDGLLVLMHDETIDRTTTGVGRVNDLTLAELEAARLQDNGGRETAFAVPTLDAALDWSRGRGVLLLDVKEDAAVEAMVRAIGRAQARSRAGLIVYSADQAVRARRVDPQLTVFYPAETAGALRELAARGVALKNLVAFAGVERQAPAAWRAIKAQGVPLAFGTLFFTDHAVAMTGANDHYAYLSGQGVDVLATDRHHQAFAAIDRERSVSGALRACGVDGA